MTRKIKTFYKIFFSYVLILIIPISIIGTINYIKTSSIVETAVKRENMTMLRQAADVIDVRAKELDKLSFELSSNPRIRSFLYNSGPMDVDTRLLIMDVIKDLAVYRAPNNFLDDIFIYSKKNGVIVSSSGMYTPYMFYNAVYKYKGMSYKEWKQLLDQYHYKHYVPSQDIAVDSRNSKEITYLQSLPQNESNEFGSLIVFIGENQYSTLMSRLVKDSKGYYYILDSQGNVISTNDKRGIYARVIDGNTGTANASQTIDYVRNNAVISYVTSSYNKWKYITITPLNVFMKQVKGVKEFTVGLVLFCAFIGLIISYYIAGKSYKPVKEILSYINSDRLSVLPDDKYDDYKTIYSVIRKSYSDIAAYKEEIKKYKPVFRQDLLMRLLNGSILNVPLEELSKNTDIDLNFDLFSVILVNLNFKDASQGTDVEMGLLRLTVMRNIEDALNRIGAGYIMELSGGLIGVIFTQDGDVEACRGDLGVFSQEVKEFVESELHFKVNIGVGNIYLDYKNIATSYEEARIALDYAILKGMDILFYEDIKVENVIYDFPVQKEISLTNCIKAGDDIHAMQIIDELYRENICEKRLSLQMMKYFVYDIYSTVLKAAYEINAFGMYNIFDTHSDFLICGSIKCSIEKIKALVENICINVNSRKKGNKKLFEEIISYIDGNFTDIDISLDKVAEHFNLSSQYLSRFFKEHAGFNYIDYLNKKRIERAKSLLSNSNCRIKDVAYKSGFENVNTFIKVFKKYEGITPGQFRASL
ncbi:helix-turn-helix domain-containing protein [Caldanaerobius polysaccharolyticus]|uniref:helix-turn-helix domain-containing protein n=1 Tax=Caldanaerobius polysaccharolyticus TaxID=44256 RepID=UPI00047A14AC|nr:helix-turn-helix domain-containing protein [Caldanaerobius polysaccharolyticus]